MLARLKRRLFSHYQIIRRSLLLSGLAVALLALLFLTLPLLRLGKEFLFGPVNVFSVVFPRSSELKNDNGRVNILVLGIGDPGHDGPNLTDTMMVVSAKIDAPNTIDLISLPRDIYLDSLGGKINTAYALGANKSPDIGLVMAKAVVGEVTGLPIQYAVVVDFSVFERVVDLVGGVDVNVETAFDDPEYPIDGKENDPCNGDPEFKCRYQTLHFAAGVTHMDGATALKFVRSRHAQSDEGTDFARGRRQQQVLAALKGKLLSGSLLLNPSKILEIYSELKAHINTDMDSKEAGKVLNLALKFKNSRVKNIVLDLSVLENPPIDDRGWILTPKGGDWREVHQFLTSQLE
ncbi:LCP family protein [Candidatus Microgenomates bacterium]|nr:LCP family protein [Candidatus Microgenomates bacterium]